MTNKNSTFNELGRIKWTDANHQGASLSKTWLWQWESCFHVMITYAKS